MSCCSTVTSDVLVVQWQEPQSIMDSFGDQLSVLIREMSLILRCTSRLVYISMCCHNRQCSHYRGFNIASFPDSGCQRMAIF